MSKLIAKFKPPRLSEYDLQNGVRYLVEEEIEDFLGQKVKAGDIVVYGSVNDSLEIGKVIGIYTKVSTKGTEPSQVSIAIDRRSWRNERVIKRQSVYPKRITKVHPDYYTDKIRRELLEA